LEVRALRKSYGRLEAVRSVDFTVDAGARHGLIGPNGSGKSSVMHLISGSRRPNGGSISLYGVEITRWTPARRARGGIAVKFQSPRIFMDLSVEENLVLAAGGGRSLARSFGRRTDELIRREVELRLDQVGLREFTEQAATNLSHGQQQWLELGMVLVTQPRLLLLDEPTAGMSPSERAETAKIIVGLSKGIAVVVVEHDFEFVRDVCSVVTVLDQGRSLVTAHPDELADIPVVSEAYSGWSLKRSLP
jgi:branched-chain amino acid transport system ATP-binding protein